MHVIFMSTYYGACSSSQESKLLWSTNVPWLKNIHFGTLFMKNIILRLRLTPGFSSLFMLSHDTVFVSYDLCLYFPGYFHNFMLSYSCDFFPALHF